MGREGKREDRHAGDGTSTNPQAFGFCGDGDGQSGLGAYVRATTTYHWTISGNGLNLSHSEHINCEMQKALCWRTATFASDCNIAQMAKVFEVVHDGEQRRRDGFPSRE